MCATGAGNVVATAVLLEISSARRAMQPICPEIGEKVSEKLVSARVGCPPRSVLFTASWVLCSWTAFYIARYTPESKTKVSIIFHWLCPLLNG